MRQLKPNESRVAAVVLAVLTLALAYLLLVHWWFTAPMLELSARMQPLQQQQQHYADIISQRGELQKRLAKLAANPTDSHAFLSGTDGNAASASLMQRVVAVVGAHSGLGPCKVTQKMPIPTAGSSQEPYRKVSANINMLCNMQSLAAVVYDLEYGHPVVFVDSFAAYRNQVRGPDQAASPLTVQLQISGYMRAPGGERP